MNLPVNRQFKIIQQVFNDRFGLSVDVDERVSKKDAVTRLIEAYVAMENMATALNVPAKIIGLNGRLKFTLENSNNKVRWHTSGLQQTRYQLIGANDFAHEWFSRPRLLDHGQLRRRAVGGARDAGRSGRTRGVRGDEQAFRDGVPKKLRDALERVMQPCMPIRLARRIKLNSCKTRLCALRQKGVKQASSIKRWKKQGET